MKVHAITVFRSTAREKRSNRLVQMRRAGGGIPAERGVRTIEDPPVSFYSLVTTSPMM